MAFCRGVSSLLPRPLFQVTTLRTFCAKASAAAEKAIESAAAKHKRTRIVMAVGGNALIRRGERLTIENQLKAARRDAAPLVKALLEEYELVLTHGNGPQVGELALERSAATFDVLGAESQGQIGYIFSQALHGVGVTAVPIVTQVMVDPSDPAFNNPTKFVGPVYGAKEADALAKSLGWAIKQDGEYFRRVVPSPPPLEILQVDAVHALLAVQKAAGPLPIICGGGGVPVTRMGNNFANIPAGAYEGLEAVIDKDVCGSLLANKIDAEGFIILTDGGGIWQNFGKPDAREMQMASTEYLKDTGAGQKFPGSMGPKVRAAIAFVEKSSNPNAWSAIGDLKDAKDIVSNKAGTLIKKSVDGGVIWRTQDKPLPKASKVPKYP